MDKIYQDIRRQARSIAARFPSPAFYRECAAACADSRDFFVRDPLVREIRELLMERIDNDFGHGADHLEKVAVDAGALILVEGRAAGYPCDRMDRRLQVAQCAGLLHDIRRKEKQHALRSAEYAQAFLADYPFSFSEVEEIADAIRNHEAFQEEVAAPSGEGALLSDCLYDADKFRWGPDNFTATIWEMVSFSKTPLSKFMTHYPRGMKMISSIKSTFRSATGRLYGPQFIETGIAIGEELKAFIDRTYSGQLEAGGASPSRDSQAG